MGERGREGGREGGSGRAHVISHSVHIQQPQMMPAAAFSPCFRFRSGLTLGPRLARVWLTPLGVWRGEWSREHQNVQHTSLLIRFIFSPHSAHAFVSDQVPRSAHVRLTFGSRSAHTRLMFSHAQLAPVGIAHSLHTQPAFSPCFPELHLAHIDSILGKRQHPKLSRFI